MRKPAHYYDRQRRKGRVYSAILHLAMLLLAVFGLPSLLSRPPEEPMAITLDIVPISAISNIQPSEQHPAEKPKEAPKPPEKKEEAKEPPKPVEHQNAKATPPVKTEAPKPPPPPPPPPKPAEPKPKPPEPKKPQEKPKPKPRPKPEEDPLNAILKSVQKEAKKEAHEEKKPEKNEGGSHSRTLSSHFDPSQMISLSEKDAIRSQIAHCWSVPAGAKDAQDLVVTLRIQLAQDGSVLRVEVASDSKRHMGEMNYRAAAESAIRAVKECSPLKNLPPEKYEGWRDMELTFDPKDMLL